MAAYQNSSSFRFLGMPTPPSNAGSTQKGTNCKLLFRTGAVSSL